MLFALLLSNALGTPPIAEVTETVVADTIVADTLSAAMASVPAEVSAIYALSLSGDRNALTVDPKHLMRRDISSVGFQTTDSANGGKVITLEGGPFRGGRWTKTSFAALVPDEARRNQLRAAGYDPMAERHLLVVRGQRDTEDTLFAFSRDASKLGIVGLCHGVTVIDFGAPSAPMVVRKPVIYLYPQRITDVTVNVSISGDGAGLSTVYPAMGANGWVVTAGPSGRLRDERTGRSHDYLFWEGTGARFTLDNKDAYSVPREDTVDFLERTCAAFALTDRECGDFVTYWLPDLERHPHNLIGFLDLKDYNSYASLQIDPEPDTLIRLFLLFRGMEAPLAAGNPAMPSHDRRGFTVVEWGGLELEGSDQASGAAR